MLDVVVHAFRALLASGEEPAAIALLQPTSPFLRSQTIDRAIDHFQASSALILKAVRRVRDHPAWMLVRRGERLESFLGVLPPRRQDLQELFIPCGALYLYRREYLEAPREAELPRLPPRKRTRFHEAPREAGLPGCDGGCDWIEVGWPESLDIDEPLDLQLAQWILAEGLAGPESPGRRG
jgi:CMP-N-acetylneuraminic acid synthetase